MFVFARFSCRSFLNTVYVIYSALYVAGIMMYKLGLEFFNGSITTLATDRFRAANTFTKREISFLTSSIPNRY